MPIEIWFALVVNRTGVLFKQSYWSRTRHKSAKMKWEALLSKENYNIIKHTYDNGDNVISSMLENIPSYFQNFGYILIYLYYSSKINVIFAVMSLVGLVISYLISQHFHEKKWVIISKNLPAQNEKEYYLNLLKNKDSRREGHFYLLSQYLYNRWRHLNNDIHKKENKVFLYGVLTGLIGDIVLATSFLICLIVTAIQIRNGETTFGTFAVILIMAEQLYYVLIDIKNKYDSDKTNFVYLDNYRKFLDMEEYELSSKKYVFDVLDIEVSNLFYQYPQSTSYVLTGINFSLRQGEKVMIVGTNGSGKTTLIDVLSGVISTSGTSVILNKQTIDNYSYFLQKFVGVIQQDFGKYSISVRENLQLGTDCELTMNEMIEVTEKVGLHDAIMKLPNQYDTKLGQIDSGVEFSQGQWQKLTIARLLLNKENRVWILDEPTAFLDPLAEIEVYDLINKLSHDRSVVFVSHRLGFAKFVDRIIVMENGKIIDEGKHHDLLKTSGLYANMYLDQKSWYTSLS